MIITCAAVHRVTRSRHVTDAVLDREEDRLKRIQDEGWDRFACVAPCFPDRFTALCCFYSDLSDVQLWICALHFDTAVCNACALALSVMCWLHCVFAVLAAHAGPLACTDACCCLLADPSQTQTSRQTWCLRTIPAARRWRDASVMPCGDAACSVRLSDGCACTVLELMHVRFIQCKGQAVTVSVCSTRVAMQAC